jgi:hypothetical protein
VTAPLVLRRVPGASPLEMRAQIGRFGTLSGGLSGSIPGQQRRARTAVGGSEARSPTGTPSGTGPSRVGECRSEPHQGGAGLPSQGPSGEWAATPGAAGPMVSQRLLNEIRATAETYFRARGADSSRLLEDTVREAIQASNEEYGVAAAVHWAAGYRFPEEMVKSDECCLQAAQLDFVAMVRRRLITLEPARLNRKRANGLSVDNPERELVMELATKGMFVPLPTGFEPNGQSATAPLRQS